MLYIPFLYSSLCIIPAVVVYQVKPLESEAECYTLEPFADDLDPDLLFKQLTTTSGSDESLSYEKSARGHMLLRKDDQVFTLNRRKADTLYWECVKKKHKETKCNARLVTHFGRVKSVRGEHNHDKRLN